MQRSREVATSESPERVRQVSVHVQVGRVEEELEERHGAASCRHLGVGVARLYLQLGVDLAPEIEGDRGR